MDSLAPLPLLDPSIFLASSSRWSAGWMSNHYKKGEPQPRAALLRYKLRMKTHRPTSARAYHEAKGTVNSHLKRWGACLYGTCSARRPSNSTYGLDRGSVSVGPTRRVAPTPAWHIFSVHVAEAPAGATECSPGRRAVSSGLRITSTTSPRWGDGNAAEKTHSA